MRMPWKNLLSLLVVGSLIALLGSSLLSAGKPAPAPVLYTFTDLGGFDGLTAVQSEARAVSNVDADGLLTVVGYSYTAVAHEFHPAQWTVTAGGVVLDVEDLSGSVAAKGAWAMAVNDDGVSAGCRIEGQPFRLFAFVPGVGQIELPSFGGMNSRVAGINNSGDIVGYADDAQRTPYGALWHIDEAANVTGPINLGTFYPAAINDSGVMAGKEGGIAAIGWLTAGGILQTDSLGLLAPSHVGSDASAINNLGEVVGTSNASSIPGTILAKAFIWRAGTMTSLGHLGGGTSSASSINDSGHVVGWSSDSHGRTVAFLWHDDTINNLNTLAGLGNGSKAVTATGINNDGHIVGMAQVSISRRVSELHGYLLTPKP